MVVEPGDTESSIRKGPNFDDESSRTTDPDLVPVQVWLDYLVTAQDKR